jgi:hypothetical protein
MDCGPRFVVNWCIGLRLEVELARVCSPSERACRMENFFLETSLVLENKIEVGRIEERTDRCGKLLPPAFGDRTWKKRDRRKLD